MKLGLQAVEIKMKVGKKFENGSVYVDIQKSKNAGIFKFQRFFWSG